MKIFLVKYVYKGKKIGLFKIIKDLKRKNIKKLCIFYTTQYEKISEKLEKDIRKNFVVFRRQITGCCIKLKPVDAYLYVGDGLFHPLSILKEQIDNFILKYESFDVKNLKPVFIINRGIKQSIRQLGDKEVRDQVNAIKARWLNFNKAKNIGILVSVKPGQENFDLALKIKNKIKKIKKQPFLFLCNEIDVKEFMNFDIDFWINTACPQFSVEGHTNMCNLKEFFIFYNLLEKARKER